MAMKKAFNAGLIVLILVACGAAVWMLSGLFQVQAPTDYEPIIENPIAGSVVMSPLPVRGYAHANWFANGGFEVEVQNDNGDVIGRGIAVQKEKSESLRNFYAFEATLTFEALAGESGVVILKRTPLEVNGEIFTMRTEIPVTF